MNTTNSASGERVPLMLLSDEPICEDNRDGLDIEPWSRIVAEVVIGTDGPLTVGVFGSWGVGKTSLLQLAKSFIDKERRERKSDLITVMFNAWQFDKENIPVIPLIATILGEIERTRKFTTKAKGGIKELQSALRSILSSLSTGVKGGAPGFGEIRIEMDLQKAFDRYEKLRKNWIDQQIEKSGSLSAIKSLDDAWQETNKIVVFIDDLDRCMPDKAIDLLESIKLILFQRGFIFVIAMDKAILESYLDKRYRREFGLKKYQHGQSYLDKLIQVPLWIPQHNDRFISFIDNLLSYRAPWSTSDLRFIDQFGENKVEFESLHEPLGLACQYNPRQLVRILNHLLIDQRIYSANSNADQFPLDAFLVARGIRHQSEEIYNFLLSHFSVCREISDCENLEALRDLFVKLVSGSTVDPDVRAVFPMLLERGHLCKLLISVPGKEWLKNETRQKEVDRFIFEDLEALEANNYRLYRERQIHIAIGQIYSENSDDIMAGCQKLVAFRDPVPAKALTRLRELLIHNDPNVKREAEAALTDLAAEVVC